MKHFYSNSPRTGLSQFTAMIPRFRVIVDPHAAAELQPACAKKICVDNHDHRGGTVSFIQRSQFYWRSPDRPGAFPKSKYNPQNLGSPFDFPLAAAGAVSLGGRCPHLHLQGSAD